MSERQYYDPDGKPCTLLHLCKKEPEWAASRIEVSARDERKRIIAKLREKADYWMAYDRHGPRRALPIFLFIKELETECE